MLALAWVLGEAAATGPAQGVVRGALHGIAAVAAGQIVGTVLRLAVSLKGHVLGATTGALLALTAFLLMTVLRLPLLWVLLGLGGGAWAVTYVMLRRRARPAEARA